MLGNDYPIRDDLFRRNYHRGREEWVPWDQVHEKDVPLIGAELMTWLDVARHVEVRSSIFEIDDMYLDS